MRSQDHTLVHCKTTLTKSLSCFNDFGRPVEELGIRLPWKRTATLVENLKRRRGGLRGRGTAARSPRSRWCTRTQKDGVSLNSASPRRASPLMLRTPARLCLRYARLELSDGTRVYLPTQAASTVLKELAWLARRACSCYRLL